MGGDGALKACIVCGDTRLARRRVSVRNRAGKVVSVTAEVCPSCGERYYDLAAMRALNDRGRK